MTLGRRNLVYVALALAGLAATLFATSAYLLDRWSELGPAAPDEADRAFAAARAGAGGGPAYMEISETGRVHLRRELERSEPEALASLDLLAWDPDRERLLRLSFPFWFVRMKMSDKLNLGTLTSALAGDWENIDLKVSVEELRRLGPGIVLDHRFAGGGRLLLWTRSAGGSAREGRSGSGSLGPNPRTLHE